MLRRIGLAFVFALILVANTALAAGDPLSSQQWALQRLQAAPAWAAGTGRDVVVAVVDTGVNFDHEDLQGKSAGSYTCIGSCRLGGQDDNGHGTLVAGVIAATTNNGRGVAGVAPGARIMSVKVLAADGSGRASDVARGVRWAADHGAKVINLSLGTDLPVPIVLDLVGRLDPLGLLSNPLQAAIGHAWRAGAVVVAAAGNSGLITSYLLSQHVLVVGATGPRDEIARYSASLLGVTLHAPGGNASGSCTPADCVLTTERGGGYRAVQGTSFAAPHVSGVAALLVGAGRPNAAAVSQILTTADPIAGGRRINASRAMGIALR